MGLGWVGIFVWAELYVSRARLIPLEEVHKPFSRIRKRRLTAELLALACVRSFPGCPCLCYLDIDAEEHWDGKRSGAWFGQGSHRQTVRCSPQENEVQSLPKRHSRGGSKQITKKTKADIFLSQISLKFLSQVISYLRKVITLELSVDWSKILGPMQQTPGALRSMDGPLLFWPRVRIKDTGQQLTFVWFTYMAHCHGRAESIELLKNVKHAKPNLADP